MEAENSADSIVNNETSATVIDTEIESLKSIFITELEVVQSQSQPWILAINLEPSTADNKEARYVRLTLHITVPEMYPDDLPTVVIKNPRGLSEEGINRILKDIASKSEIMRGNAMLYELIDVAKEYLTFWNMPSCQCAICLYDFSQQDVFTKTECYHYFHSHCLTKFVKYSKSQFEEDEPKGIEQSGMVALKFQAECPICRKAINFECDESFPAPSAAAAAADEPFEISEDIREIQEKLASLYENQKAKGGIIDLEEEKNKYLLEISSVPTMKITLATESRFDEELAASNESLKKRPELKNAEYLRNKVQSKISDTKNESEEVKDADTEEDPEVHEERDNIRDNDKKESPTGSKPKVRTQQDRRPNNFNNRGGNRYGGGGYNNYNDNYRRPSRGGYNQYNNRDNNRDWYGNNRRNYNRYPNNRDYNDYYDGGRPQRSSNPNKDSRRVRQDSDTKKVQLNGDSDTQDTHLNNDANISSTQDEQNDAGNVKPNNRRGSYREQRPRNNNGNNRRRDSRKESVNSNDKESKDLNDDKSNEITSPNMERNMARSSPNRRNRFNSKNSANSEVEEVASLNNTPPQNDEGNNANKRSGGNRGGRNFRRGSNKPRNKSSFKEEDSSSLNSLSKDFEKFIHEFKDEEKEKNTRNICDQSSEPVKDESTGSNPDNHEENGTISNCNNAKSDERPPGRNGGNNFRPPQQNRYNGYNNSRGGRQQFPRQSRPGNYRRPGNYDYQDRDSYNNRGNYNSSYNRVPNSYNNYGPRSYRNGDSRGSSDGYQRNQSSHRQNMDKPRPNLGNVAYNRDANSPKIRHPEAQFHPPGIPVMKPVVTNQSMGESDV